MTIPKKARWTIIIMALFAMMTSAMMAANIVRKSDGLITTIQKEISSHENIITSLWQNALAEENKAHHVVLYALITHQQNNPDIADLDKDYKKFSSLGFEQPLSLKEVPALLNTIDTEKQNTIDNINDRFLEKQKLEQEITLLAQKNTTLWNIAMFIQLLSLAIITIVRDLK